MVELPFHRFSWWKCSFIVFGGGIAPLLFHWRYCLTVPILTVPSGPVIHFPSPIVSHETMGERGVFTPASCQFRTSDPQPRPPGHKPEAVHWRVQALRAVWTGPAGQGRGEAPRDRRNCPRCLRQDCVWALHHSRRYCPHRCQANDRSLSGLDLPGEGLRQRCLREPGFPGRCCCPPAYPPCPMPCLDWAGFHSPVRSPYFQYCLWLLPGWWWFRCRLHQFPMSDFRVSVFPAPHCRRLCSGLPCSRWWYFRW